MGKIKKHKKYLILTLLILAFIISYCVMSFGILIVYVFTGFADEKFGWTTGSIVICLGIIGMILTYIKAEKWMEYVVECGG